MVKGTYSVQIRGAVVTVYLTSNKGTKSYIKRRIVEPEWIQLYYKVLNGEFDEALWMHLNDKDRHFMGYVFNTMGIENKHLNVALARDSKKHIDTLRVIEGEILAGNTNIEMMKQFDDILSHLVESKQLNQRYATMLKKRLARTIQSVS